MRFPEIKISIARLGSSDPANSDSLMSAGADKISNSLTQWRDQVVQISYVTP